jgi:hypothetical protein
MEVPDGRFWNDLVGRLSGPFTFRFVLQPLMGLIYALRDGLKDAKAGRPPYFWAIFTDASARQALLREGWHATLRVIVLGVVMDLVYQFIVLKAFRPLELVVIVALLAFVPYVLARGPMNRIASHFLRGRKSSAT